MSLLRYRIARRLPHRVRDMFLRLHPIKRIKSPLGLTAVISIAAIVGSLSYYAYYQRALYQYGDEEKKLLSEVSVNTGLIRDNADTVVYNRRDESANKKEQLMVVADAADATGKAPYRAELHKDPSKGLSFSDTKDDRVIRLIPQFDLEEGRLENGRMLYPASTNERHTYTFKRNGIKEDIILSRPDGDTKTYSWKLDTGSDLEARMLPDGGVGIYSADPVLYGDLQISDEKSQKLVENARKNGDKNYILFELPRPYILDSEGRVIYEGVSYKLESGILTLTARGLESKEGALSYPISIDPTITVTTTSDFRQRTGNDGNIDYGTSGQINRDNDGFGYIGTWTTDTSSYFSAARYDHATLAYNGYMYILGGSLSATGTGCKDAGSSFYCNDVQYAAINGDGTLGTWTLDSSSYFSIPRYQFGAIVHNGYMYVIGGHQGAADTDCKDAGNSSACNDVQYAVINSDGSLGTWTTDTSSYFTYPRRLHSVAVYNGYMYVMGGTRPTSDTNCKSSGTHSYCSDVQYAPINGDGSLGAWTTDASSYFSIPRASHASVAYNGYLYIVGGILPTSDATCKDSGSSFWCNDVQYAPINNDGSLGTWVTDSSSYISIPRGYPHLVVENGYLYVLGGSIESSSTSCKDSGTSTYCNDVQYALLNTDGSIGPWVTDTTSYFTTARDREKSVVYNGYLYVTGGQTTSTTSCKDSGTSIACNDVQYAAFGTGTSPGTWTTDATSYFNDPRSNHGYVAYNGYLYIAGGAKGLTSTACRSDASDSFYCNDIQYAPINADGSLGTWTRDTSSYFTEPRIDFGMIAHHGYMYIVGGALEGSSLGCKNSGSSAVCNDVQYAPINSDGSLGTWTIDSDSYFTSARSNLNLVANDKYLYIIAGTMETAATSCKNTGVTTTECSDVQYATINANGSLGAWTLDSSSYISVSRYSASAYTYSGYVYITGGATSASDGSCVNGAATIYCTDTQYAAFNADGSLGAWTRDTSSYLPEAKYYHSASVQNGVLYITAGLRANSSTNCKNSGTSSVCNELQYATINSDGSLGTWSTDSNAYFNFPRYGAAFVLYNGFFYIAGGTIASASTDCKNAGNELTCNDVQYIRIGQVGAIEGSFQTDTSSYFTTTRYAHRTVAYNGYLYVIGGSQGVSSTACKNSGTSSLCNDVQYAPINSDGSLGTWTTDSSSYFSAPRFGHTAVAHRGYMYILGGNHTVSDTACTDGSATAFCNDVQYAPINSDGSLGTWTTDSSSYFSFTRSDHATVVHNGYIYIMGGFKSISNTNCRNAGSGTTCNDVQYAAINSDGTLGTWATDTSSYFTSPRYAHTATSYGGYIYLATGFLETTLVECKHTTSAAHEWCNDVQYAPINGDGSLGTWTTDVTSYVVTPRYGAALSAYNGYLYITGGDIENGSTACKDSGTTLQCNDVQFAAIQPDGSLGGWQTDSNSYFITPRESHGMVIYNGYMYIVGGLITSGTACKDSGTSVYCNDVVYGSLSGISQKARYERMFDTTSAGNILTSFTINGTSVCGYHVSYKLAGSDHIFGTATILPNVMPGVSQAITGGSSKRHVQLIVTLDDAACGGASNITSISLLYNGSPDVPTLLIPADGATGVSTLPEFRIGSADDSLDYIRYRIEVCSDSNCNTIIRTIDQTASQTGWQGQGTQSGTAYTGGEAITQYAIHQYQPTALNTSTQYWWRASAIDPGGTNTWSPASAIRSFTTEAAAAPERSIRGGVQIRGGTQL